MDEDETVVLSVGDADKSELYFIQVDIHLCWSEMPMMIDNITYLHCLTDVIDSVN